MPIKAFKGFTRRRSAGNILDPSSPESTSSPTESSFRVLTREEAANAARNARAGIRRPSSSPLTSTARHSSSDAIPLAERTNNISSTGHSTRCSYQSTQPSSIGSFSQDDLPRCQSADLSPAYHPRPQLDEDQPDSRPALASNIKNRFSLNTHPRLIPTTDISSSREDVLPFMDRSMTSSSSASTAHATQSGWEETRLQMAPASAMSVPRRSWESNASSGAFVSGPSYQDSERMYKSRSFSPTRSPRSSQASPSLENQDQEGLLAAAWASEELDRQYGTSPTANRGMSDRQGAGFGPSSQSLQASHYPPPRPQNCSNQSTSSLETQKRTSMGQGMARPVMQRVMTPAEFETFKHSTNGRKHDNEQNSSDSDAYEDEDETEDDKQRAKELVKQRRKQEARLSVYRQQMMKVTGDQSSDSQARPNYDRAARSMPNVNRTFTLDPKTTPADSGGKISDDSDEDIPLAVLQAHGFPSRSCSPAKVATGNATPQTRPVSQMSTYPVPTGATRNDKSAGGGGNPALPVFARNLPKDPYIGASLVNAPNRESMQQHSSQVPPGGLVGVIAGEERARAMRRGSPNTYGVYGPPPSDRSSMPHQMQIPHHGMPPSALGMPFTPLGQPLTPSELSQIEVNNSMAQMMQMQMQFMQQMMAMQAGQSGATPVQMPNFVMPQTSQTSGGGLEQPVAGLPAPNQAQRASSRMSAMDMNRNGSNFGSGSPLSHAYAPSIAPSERSNIGQPPRYRPVTPMTIANAARNSRTNGMPLSNGSVPNLHYGTQMPRQRSRSPHKLDLPGQGLGAVPPSSTIRAINKPKRGGGTGSVSEEEEEDQAWADVRRKREERRNRWAMRKKEKERAEMPQEGLEGLYYNG